MKPKKNRERKRLNCRILNYSLQINCSSNTLLSNEIGKYNTFFGNHTEPEGIFPTHP